MGHGRTVVRALRIRRRRRFWFSYVVAAALLEEVRLADVVVAHFGPTGRLWLPVAFLARRRFAVYFHGYDVGAVLHRDPDAYADLFALGAALLTLGSRPLVSAAGGGVSLAGRHAGHERYAGCRHTARHFLSCDTMMNHVVPYSSRGRSRLWATSSRHLRNSSWGVVGNLSDLRRGR